MRKIKTLALGLALGLAFTVTVISRAQGTRTPATADDSMAASCCTDGASCCMNGGGSCCAHGACHMRAAR